MKASSVERAMYLRLWRLAECPSREVIPPNELISRRKASYHRHDRARARRNAIMLGARVGDQRRVRAVYRRAAWWRSVGFPVVVDHIVPLSKGGAHSPENLQIIYGSENAKKGARLDYQPSVVFGHVFEESEPTSAGEHAA